MELVTAVALFGYFQDGRDKREDEQISRVGVTTQGGTWIAGDLFGAQLHGDDIALLLSTGVQIDADGEESEFDEHMVVLAPGWVLQILDE